MFDTKITAIHYYVPEKKLSIDELLSTVPNSDIPEVFSTKEKYADFIRSDLQLDTIRIETNLSDEQMLIRAVEPIFMNDEGSPEEIDLIIMAQEHDQRQKENLGQFIQYEFDLNNAYVINLSGNHCANIDYALTIGSEIAQANNRINNVLILGNVKIKKNEKRLVGTYGILSDGSGAMLLKKGSSGIGLHASNIVSAGRLYDVNLNRDDSLLLYKYQVKCLQELLKNSGTDPENIDYIITQNANSLLIAQCLESVGLDAEKVFTDNKTRFAHVDCLDFLINLKDLKEKVDKDGQKRLVLSFGMGWAGSFISSLLSYD